MAARFTQCFEALPRCFFGFFDFCLLCLDGTPCGGGFEKGGVFAAWGVGGEVGGELFPAREEAHEPFGVGFDFGDGEALRRAVRDAEETPRRARYQQLLLYLCHVVLRHFAARRHFKAFAAGIAVAQQFVFYDGLLVVGDAVEAGGDVSFCFADQVVQRLADACLKLRHDGCLCRVPGGKEALHPFAHGRSLARGFFL